MLVVRGSATRQRYGFKRFAPARTPGRWVGHGRRDEDAVEARRLVEKPKSSLP